MRCLRETVSNLTFGDFPVCDSDTDGLEELRSESLLLVTATGERVAALFEDCGYDRAVLYSHGRGDQLSDIEEDIELLAEKLGANVLAYDYLGFGASDRDEPSEEGCYLAIDAAYDFLLKHHAPDRIVAFGESLGTGPTIDLVSRHPEIAGMMVSAPLASAIQTVRGGQVLAGLFSASDLFQSYKKITAVRCPVLFSHGTADSLVPMGNSQLLLKSCPNAVEPNWIPGFDHDQVVGPARDNATVLPPLRRFLDTVVPSDCVSPASLYSSESEWSSSS
eukprot:TRINITY_DN55931_c0_g1_i1.p1 TRINITY_DN55931_c0_g1~~TRINITY_DN55931_c0_g1_i1.p1  ORF type:complete len:277 (+),score=30.13 TRINITY_DN55931_c0_g1_i1:136-966(+)